MNRWKLHVAFFSLAIEALIPTGCLRSSQSGPETSAEGGAPAAKVAPRAEPRPERLAKATTTREILDALADDCYACAQKNGCLDPQQQGGSCETVTGKAKGGRTETEQCLETLRCVFTSKCANSGEQSPCLCGKTDVQECMEGKSPPSGTCVAVYKDDFGSNGKAMYDQFLDRKFGSGNANAIIQCVIPLCPSCRIR
jgi:hypothetical protein